MRRAGAVQSTEVPFRGLMLAGQAPQLRRVVPPAKSPVEVDAIQRARRAAERASIKPYQDITDQTFGCVTAKEYVGSAIGSGNALWRCSCDACGSLVLASTSYLRQHPPKKCGKHCAGLGGR